MTFTGRFLTRFSYLPILPKLFSLTTYIPSTDGEQGNSHGIVHLFYFNHLVKPKLLDIQP